MTDGNTLISYTLTFGMVFIPAILFLILSLMVKGSNIVSLLFGGLAFFFGIMAYFLSYNYELYLLAYLPLGIAVSSGAWSIYLIGSNLIKDPFDSKEKDSSP